MCGIAGYCLNNEIKPSMENITRLLNSIQRRGPDDEGVGLISRPKGSFQNYKTNRTHPALRDRMPHIHDAHQTHDVAFIHTRYAILDLTEKGHQPYVSLDKSIIGVFNGEIYNYLELRKELLSLGVHFQTNCDTEVLVEGYAFWKDELWSKLNGFWAVVLYDFSNRSLILSRDRMGVAPLYYRQTSAGLYFSSYIEPLVQIEDQKADLNEDAILGFVQTGYKDIEETTFYKEIKSFPAATVVKISNHETQVSSAVTKCYWSLPTQVLKEEDISIDQAIKDFRALLLDAVDIRLRADVKVAFELSGGLDSSSVVAAAALLNKNPITTYTAKIKNADEEPFARSMLQKYKLDYRIIKNMEDNFINDYGSFSNLMEEPYDNPNAYTHYQMLKTMRQEGVKVVITGAGGDEVLAGYEASFWPKAYRQWRSEGFSSYLKADWYEYCRRFKTFSRSADTFSHYFLSPWRRLVKAKGASGHSLFNLPSKALAYSSQYGNFSFNEQRRFHFEKALLPYYMRSSDHFTMGIPVEHRFPLLDYRLVEFGLRLPISYLFRNGWTKYILRKAMEPYLPAKIVWRRQKMGFQFPFQRYLGDSSKVFYPALQDCYHAFPQMKFLGSYDELLRSNPVLLWRLLSVGIWQKGFCI